MRRGPSPVIIKPLKYDFLPLYIEKLIEKYKNGESLDRVEMYRLSRYYGAPFRIVKWFLDRNDDFMRNFPKCPSCGNDINICYYTPFRLVDARWMPKCRNCILAGANIEECKKRLMKLIDQIRSDPNKKFCIRSSYMMPLIAYYGKPPLQIFYHFQIGDYELKKIPKCRRCGRVALFFNSGKRYVYKDNSSRKYGYKEYCDRCYPKIMSYNIIVKLGYTHLSEERNRQRCERIGKVLLEKYGSRYIRLIQRYRQRKFSRNRKALEAYRNILKKNRIELDKINYCKTETEFKKTVTYFRKRGVEDPEAHAALWLEIKNDKVWWENAILHEQLTVGDLADIFNVSKDTIRRILKKYDLTMKKVAQMPEEELKNKGNLEFIDSIVKYDGIF